MSTHHAKQLKGHTGTNKARSSHTSATNKIIERAEFFTVSGIYVRSLRIIIMRAEGNVFQHKTVKHVTIPLIFRPMLALKILR